MPKPAVVELDREMLGMLRALRNGREFIAYAEQGGWNFRWTVSGLYNTIPAMETKPLVDAGYAKLKYTAAHKITTLVLTPRGRAYLTSKDVT